MKDFEIDLPTDDDLVINVLDDSLYNYDFHSFSLVSLQQAAESTLLKNIKNKLLGNSALMEIFSKSLDQKDIKYVAQFTKETKEKINSGEWKLGIRTKSGEAYGVIKEVKTGKSKAFVDLVSENEPVLGELPQLAIIQHQLKDVSKQLEEINHSIKRVEQGQYNDRYAGFFSARQHVIEGLCSSNETLKQELLISAIKNLNDTISKLMLSIQQDSQEFINPKTSLKSTRELEKKLQDSIGVLNASIQLNIVVYTALEESQAVKAVLKNYHSFVTQTLLKESSINKRSVAWLMDNNKKGDTGQFLELSINLVKSIQQILIPNENEKKELLTNDK